MDKYDKRDLLTFLKHFGGWMVLLPILVLILFGPFTLSLCTNHWLYMLLYIPILSILFAIRTGNYSSF